MDRALKYVLGIEYTDLSSFISYLLKMINLFSSAFSPGLRRKKAFRVEVAMTQNNHTMAPKVYRN